MPDRPSELLSLDIPCDRNAPAVIRAALAEFDEDGLSLADVILVASELVTNAVLHSGGAADQMVSVRASLQRDLLLISVHDPGLSGKSAQPNRSKQSKLGGWGLRIVEQLAQRWGTERPDGYRVWAELAVRR
jgi:anti-sigma regulatory factor (Ser/Thr protein kinase)